MSPLLITLTTALLTLLHLPTVTHSLSYPGPTPVIAHFPFDTDYTSQYNAYTTAPPTYQNAPPPPPLVKTQSGLACPFGGCAHFDTQSYLVASPWLPLLGSVDGAALGSWSVGLWVRSEQATAWQGVLGVWGQGSYVWSFRLYYNIPYLIWQFRDANRQMQSVSLQSSRALPSTGAWSHIVITYNATSHNVQFWADGRVTDTFATTAAYAYVDSVPALGWKVGMIDDVMYGLAGGLDELWLFSDVLTGDEVLLLRAINSIGSCAPGTAGVAQYRVGTCSTCQPGTFAPDIGGLVCQVCPAGTASATAGAVACQACAAGSYAPSPNSTQCLTCPAGYYSPTPGATACLPCAAGTYSTQPGSTTCAYCPANTLSPPTATTPTQCSPCPAGSTGGGTVPVCCASGVSAAGVLLAGVGVGLGGFGVVNGCVLGLDVAQVQGSMVEQLSDYCGVGYDGVLTSSLQGLYGEFNAFQSQADQAALQRIYCNP